jgi:uncharacterized protein (DUF1800 family)
MENSKTTRRQLFRKLIVRLTNSVQEKDPLFEKYSKKVHTRRKYASEFYKNKITADNASKEAERIRPVTSGLAPYTGTWSSREAIFLLKRTGFGLKKPDVDKLTTLSVGDAVDLVVTINPTAPAPPINNYQFEIPDENDIPYGADWTNNSFAYKGYYTNYNRVTSLKSWSISLALNQDITIREKMTLFWYHLIPIDTEDILNSGVYFMIENSARLCYRYLKNYRDNATGNYKNLIRNIATQPAMMCQLNNNANTKTSPDENFAREIMELFTIGKDVPNAYTQADIVQAAKVLTGWRIEDLDTPNEKTVFKPELHDTGDKQFSAFFNNTIIRNGGDREIDTFIDMIFTKSEIISQYICRRLYRFFVYYDIDDTTEANVIKPLAQLFVNSNWEILPVLKSLFKSQHFFDMANRGVYIKSPLDFVVGTMRTFNIQHNIADPTNYDLQYRVWRYTFEQASLMGQIMGEVPNISGWQAFYQKPSYHEYWINSDTVQRRSNEINRFFNGFELFAGTAKHQIEIDFIAFVKQFPATTCQNPNLLIDICVQYLLPIDLSTDQKNKIKTKTLLSNQAADYYWTNSWNDYLANPNDMIKTDEVKKRLKEMLLTIVDLAEYQLM